MFTELFVSSAGSHDGVANPNWVQVLVVLAGLIAAIAALGAWLDQRTKARQAETKNEVREAVDQLSAVLLERLETKENVAELRVQMARMNEQLKNLGDRLHEGQKLTPS